jgi:hypothetical protein
MKPTLALIATAAVALAACGQLGGGAVVITPVPPPTEALAAWASFPAGANPRPIVWLSNPSPINGYGTGANKLAAYCYKYAISNTLPTTVPDHGSALWPDGTSATYGGISAQDALARWATSRTPVQDPQCSSYPPLIINGARLGTFDFLTDHGKALMNAWLFSAIGVDGELAYPAISAHGFWTGGMLANYASNSAVMSADGRTLTYRFYGAPSAPGPCGADYRAVVAESQSAVAIALQETPHAASGSVACPAVAEQRSVVVALAQPLGGRVVVDATGSVALVCPPTKPAC